MQQEPVRVTFVGSAPSTTTYFAAERLCVRRTRTVDTPEVAHPKRWQGERMFSLLAEGGGERGYCRSLPQGVRRLRRPLSTPAERLRSCKPYFCISFKRCKQNRNASPSCTTITLQTSLYRYHRITSLIQSSREEVDSEVSDSDL
ncbi:unnamed protein product [Coccothraustes coccothraustes]